MARPPNQSLDALGFPDTLDENRSKADQLRELLEDTATRLGGGAVMPSQRAVANHLGVARMTVRGVYLQLESEGIITVRQGSGAIVCEERLPPRSVGSSFSRDMRQRGMTPGAIVVEHTVTMVTTQLAEQLDVKPGTRALRIVRLRTANGTPIGLERTTLSLDRFPGLDHVDLEDASLYDELRNRWNVEPHKVHATASAVMPTEEEAELLQISRDQPCVLVVSIQRDNRDQVVEAGRSLYRGDRYQVDISYHISD